MSQQALQIGLREITEGLKFLGSYQIIRRHVITLVDAGLLVEARVAKTRKYTVDFKGLEELQDALVDLLT